MHPLVGYQQRTNFGVEAFGSGEPDTDYSTEEAHRGHADEDQRPVLIRVLCTKAAK